MWRLKPFLKKCKDGIAYTLERIPRKLQVLLNLLLIAMFLFAFYVFLGCPCFTPEQAYRRLEEANSVGPAQILGYEDADGLYSTKIVVAETQEGVILSQVYPKSDITYAAASLFYVEKRGDITVTPAPRDLYRQPDQDQLCLTMVVVDEYPQAVRAELEFGVFWDSGVDPEYAWDENVAPTIQYEKTYNLESQRKNAGYFRFDLPFSYNKYEVDPQAEAIFQLSQVFYYPGDWTPPADAYPATVKLYDENDQLIAEKTMHLFEQIIG